MAEAVIILSRGIINSFHNFILTFTEKRYAIIIINSADKAIEFAEAMPTTLKPLTKIKSKNIFTAAKIKLAITGILNSLMAKNTFTKIIIYK